MEANQTATPADEKAAYFEEQKAADKKAARMPLPRKQPPVPRLLRTVQVLRAVGGTIFRLEGDERVATYPRLVTCQKCGGSRDELRTVGAKKDNVKVCVYCLGLRS